MNQETRSSLQSATQELRKLLEAEFSEQLSGTYDILPDGSIADQPGQHLVDSKQRLIRRKVIEAIRHLIDSGKTAQEAVQDYIRETSYTFLNRLVALRLMEAKKLLQPCVSKGEESSGFKEFCGLAPGLSDAGAGYRLYLESIFDELSVEIKVLFNRRDAASWLWPRRPALNKMLQIFDRAELAAAWNAEDTIGWVYQFFIELEKKDVFDRVYKKKQKISSRDIPAATQIFTPRWIVRFLIENTLGRMWADMHPDSLLVGRLEYLVPIEGKRVVSFKGVKEIKLLDPSCGTMHFGLLAFDLFAEMYREERANAGKPGWPESPSTLSDEEIPDAILTNNIHGIDIDLRAVQLSALTLYLKAKSFSPNAKLSETKLACADIHILSGDHLETFIKSAGLEKRPIYGRVLKEMQQKLANSNQLGSLLRIDGDIRELISKERALFKKDGQPDLFGWSNEQFESEAGSREFWETLEIQIGQALDAFARDQAERGRDQSFFSGETTKGLKFLEVVSQQYDVVVTNPPYMTARNMNKVLKDYVASEYPAAKGDLYAAFIQRGTEWLAKQGRLGMVTQQSFMFISSYEKLRGLLRETVAIEALPHVGPRAFEEVTGEKVNTTLLVLRREPDEKVRNESEGTYFRLVKQPDAESKRERFEQAAANLRIGHADSCVFRYKQADFDAIPESPWIYSLTPGVQSIFSSLPKLKDIAQPRVGLQTGDNFRFLRYWWEVGKTRIGFDCKNAVDVSERRKRWIPYLKGGGFRRWYGNQDCVVNWDSNGKEIRNFGIETGKTFSRPQNTEFYFRRGVTYSYLTSAKFNARLSPGGFIFDVAGSSLFPEDVELMLGIMNSQFAEYVLKLLNPTVNFQVGDLYRLPIPTRSSSDVKAAVSRSVAIAIEDCSSNEATWDFLCPRKQQSGSDSDLNSQIREIEAQLNRAVFDLYEIQSNDRLVIENEINNGLVVSEELAEGTEDSDLPESAEVLEDTEDVFTTPAKSWISYATGVVFGRFRPGLDDALGRGKFSPESSLQLRELADSDGMLVLDAGHPHDLAAKARQALIFMLGERDARECIHEATGKDGDLDEELRRYFEGDFFKEHLPKYRKRPVYWLLQSPRKTYGVYLFHERITKDSLYRIRSEQYIGSKLKLLSTRLDAQQREAEGASGRQLKDLQKSIEETEVARDDLQAFASLVDNLIALGYEPNIDDGVLINMAPLWQLIPSWSTEPKKCWDKLVSGDYDWSHMAMSLWPERVIPKCVDNASFAIAHGLDGVFWIQDERQRFQRKPAPTGGWKPIVDKLVAERTRPGIKEAIEAISNSGAKPKARSKKKGGQA